MIRIKVDEAAAFDMLAIASLKANSSKEYDRILDDLFWDLGIEMTKEILKSPQYFNLLDANREVFDYIERLMNGEDFSAVEVHKANMKRFKYKKELQNKFFGSELTEQKTG